MTDTSQEPKFLPLQLNPQASHEAREYKRYCEATICGVQFIPGLAPLEPFRRTPFQIVGACGTPVSLEIITQQERQEFYAPMTRPGQHWRDAVAHAKHSHENYPHVPTY